MTELAAKYGLTLIESKTNTISLAMTLEQQVKTNPNKYGLNYLRVPKRQLLEVCCSQGESVAPGWLLAKTAK